MFSRTKKQHSSKQWTKRNWRARLSLTSFEERLTPATFTVYNPADDYSGDTLREAIEAANSNSGPDFIDFEIGTDTITLESQLEITDDVTIVGPDSERVSITRNVGAGNFRLFDINPGISHPVTIKQLIMFGGLANGADGGAINYYETDLYLEDVEIFDCTANEGNGGAIAGSGRLDIVRSYIHNNLATSVNHVRGGAIYLTSNGENGALTLVDSTLAENTSWNEFKNTAGEVAGGGIYFEGKIGEAGFLIKQSTLWGNNANEGHGGGIALFNVEGEVLITNSSIGNNHAIDRLHQNDEVGGGIYIEGFDYLELKLKSTIVAANQELDWITGTIPSDIYIENWNNTWQIEADYNLIGYIPDDTLLDGSNNIYSLDDMSPIDPMFTDLQPANNYIQVPVIGISDSSPARDTGFDFANLDWDQRGDPFNRDDGNGVDIGAYEYQ